jgi:cyclopropane fatty-acyl-phospholipid synthase-like methyltransferase
MNKDLIKQGYNQVVEDYVQNRNRLKSDKYINKLLQLMKPQSLVLDLGCGDGVPVDEMLIKKGHLVIGVDVSEEMIKRARKNCPKGDFQVLDMSNLRMKEYRVDAVVAMYSIFHTPRNEHGKLLEKINSYLPKGGLILITMGDREFEGMHNFFGVKMWSSHWGPKKNKELVEMAGFEVLVDEVDSSGGERHQVLMARKI